jgi:hypothetical protein
MNTATAAAAAGSTAYLPKSRMSVVTAVHTRRTEVKNYRIESFGGTKPMSTWPSAVLAEQSQSAMMATASWQNKARKFKDSNEAAE